MKYNIYKTSELYCKNKPYSRAYQDGYNELFGSHIWAVDVNTLEELNDIIKETNHSVIVSEDSIEIYDEFRE